MCINLKNDVPVCQRARRLSCSEKLQVNDQIDDWLQQGIIKESVFDYCSPMKSKHRRFSSGLDEKGKKEYVPLRTAYSQVGRLWHPGNPIVLEKTTQSSRAGAAK
ncbi:hypothetical protein TNCV_5041851 [Trichonephila clavipes]|nr:hypothetical protein TNCV_5041851 [Trichonephila clavipes]